jgi:thiol-disulfide isomerase/thioredoxin
MNCFRPAVCGIVAALALAAGAAADDREALKPLVDKALQAAGGDKLLALKGWSITESSSAQGKATVCQRFARLPDCFRNQTGTSADQPVSVGVVNGNKGWSVDDDRLSELPAAYLVAHRQQFFWDSAQILGPRLLADPESVLTKLPEVNIEGRPAVGIKLEHKVYATHELYLDKETGLLLRIVKDFKREDGKFFPAAVATTFSDFRTVGGLTLPHKKKNRFGRSESPAWDLQYRVTEVPDAKYFEKPDAEQLAKAVDAKWPAWIAEYRAVKREIEAELDKFTAAAVAANDPDDFLARHILERTRLVKQAAEKVLTAVRPHAAEPDAVEPLVWVTNYLQGTDLDDEAARLLTKHHPERKETIEMVYRSRLAPTKWTEPLLRAQLAAPGLAPADRPRVLYALARVKQSLAEWSATLAVTSDQGVSALEDFYGVQTIAAYRKVDAARERAEAARLYTELGEKYGPGQSVEGLTYGQLAESGLYELRNLTLGKPAPDIVGEDTGGAKFKLSDYRGKVVLLVFWGTWCGACMSGVPHEKAIAERLKGKPFALVGVNSDTDKVKFKERAGKAGVNWRSFWCGEKGAVGPIPLAWNVTTWPTVYVLDHKGVIRGKGLTGKELDRVLDELVGEVEAKK